MQLMIILSLLLNVAVLVPVTGSIILRAGWVEAAYGPASPARGILLSIYLAILVASVVILFHPLPQVVAALLAVQVLYKITTPFTASWRNPVVLSNLAIAAVHAITLWWAWPAIAA